MTKNASHVAGGSGVQSWEKLPGGELEAPRSLARCAACRARAEAARGPVDGTPYGRTACFDCHRAGLARERALRKAANLDTASEARFQSTLPFEPVNLPRLGRLKAEREVAREDARRGVGQFVDKRRQAQIAARHALHAVMAGLRARQLMPVDRRQAEFQAVHAAELQLPESWLPFVVAG